MAERKDKYWHIQLHLLESQRRDHNGKWKKGGKSRRDQEIAEKAHEARMESSRSPFSLD